MDWFKFHIGFYRHRKTLKLRRLLGNDALWLPPRLWAYCAENHTDDLSTLDDSDLADCLEYDGEGAKLRQALVSAGFLSPDGQTVAGWEERNGAAQRSYHDRAKKAAEARWGKPIPAVPATPSDPSEEEEKKKKREEREEIRKHDGSMPEASAKHASSIAHTLPNSLSDEAIRQIADGFGYTVESIAPAYRRFYEIKSNYNDVIHDPVAAFSGWLRTSKIGKSMTGVHALDHSKGFW